ncbi:MAG: class I SAM-dependent methyltransferase [Candidatus Andersenbacteria bacterium]
MAIAVTVLIVVVCLVLLVGMAFAYLRTGVPTIASSKVAQSQVATLFREAGARRIYELGSGTGGWVLRLAREVPAARVTGIEISPLPFLYAQAWRLSQPREVRARVNFAWANVKHVDLRDADAVAFYLMPGANERLKPKLLAELKPGTTVATIAFSMHGWQTAQVLVAPTFSKTRTYVYRMPPTLGPTQP